MLLILQQRLLGQDQDNLAVWLAVARSPFIIAGYIFSLLTFLWKCTWARFRALFYYCQSSALTAGRATPHPFFIPHKARTQTLHITLDFVDIFIKPQKWADLNSRLKILNGNRKKISTKYGPVVARSKTCLHPRWVCRKTPSYPKTVKNCQATGGWSHNKLCIHAHRCRHSKHPCPSLDGASWGMGERHWWEISAYLQKKNAQDLLFTQTRAAGPTKTPLSLHQEKNNHSLILLSELSVWQRLTLQLYLKFRSDIVIVTLPGEWRGLCHMSTYKHKCRAMYKREKSTFDRRYLSRKLKTILLMCCGPARQTSW